VRRGEARPRHPFIGVEGGGGGQEEQAATVIGAPSMVPLPR
jgi:hypothetical protein